VSSASATTTISLVHDDRLRLEVEPALRSAAERWIPRFASPPARPAGPNDACVRIRPATAPAAAPPPGAPTLRLMSVAAWLQPEHSRVLLAGSRGGYGTVDPDAARSELRVPVGPPADDAPLGDLFYLLTLAAALLLVRMRRTLIHAGALVAPDGRAWLLVGDSHAGKSTTCLNLIRSGWDYLSDDQVILQESPDGSGLMVEGWPRLFHLDEGWAAGAPTGRRRAVAPEAPGTGRWRRTAPLGGLLFPRVEAESPTLLQPLSAGSALAALIRQAPWLLADRVAAEPVLALLRRAALLPAHRLRLGLDTYRNTDGLLERLDPLLSR
jgi:hypothetical protein